MKFLNKNIFNEKATILVIFVSIKNYL